jgi:hypothetical protein
MYADGEETSVLPNKAGWAAVTSMEPGDVLEVGHAEVPKVGSLHGG